MMDKQTTIRYVLTGMLHSLLLLPVLNLLMDINNLSGKYTLFTFFILTQLSAALLRKGWMYGLVQTGLFFLFLYSLFPPARESALFREWLLDRWQMVVAQWRTLLAADLTEMPVLLLMTSLFLLMTVLTFLLFRFNQPLPAFFAGLVYLFILHTFTSRSILPYLIFLVGTAFLLVALTQLNVESRWQTASKTLLFTVAATFLLTALSYFSLDHLESSQEWVETKSNAYQKELDNRGFFDWINSKATGLGFRRTGMGTSTDRLGGRLHQDFSPVFRAFTQRPTYWKVMHRTTYNGLGWNSEESESQRTVHLPYTAWENDSLTVEQRQDMPESDDISTIGIEWIEELSYLAYPYGWLELGLDTGSIESDISVQLNDTSDYFTVQSEGDTPDNYTLAYDQTFPDRFDEEALRQDDGWREDLTATYRELLAEDESVQEMGTDDIIASWFEEELQLPTSLPPRVSELAEEITAGLDTEYDIVRAVETYLKEEGGYRYSLLDVENTPEGGDYVDHFLFESQVGYCDNFSTAMTVMLRSLGIPARWTKGFTPGSLIGDDGDELYFLIDNSNAHSWPEVFFPSYGWVPFEPSPSFENPVTNQEAVASIRGESYSFDDEEDILEFEDTEPDPLEQDVMEVEPEEDTTDSLEELEDDEAEETASTADQSGDQSWLDTLYPLLLILIITGSLLTFFRWPMLLWLPRLLIRKDMLSLTQASDLILRLYYLKHKSKSGQTVQMYMNEWKPFAFEHKQTLDQFSDLADRAYYGPEKEPQRPSQHQKDTLTSMLELYPSLPHADDKATHTI